MCREGGGGEFLRVCAEEDKDKENEDKTTEGMTNYVAQRLFIRGLTRPRPPPYSDDGPLIIIMPGPRREGIASCDADGRGRVRYTQGHDGEECTGDRGEVVGSDGGEPTFPHPPDASISSPGGRGVKGDMKRVGEVSLEFLPQNDADGLRSGGRRDIDDNKNEIVEVEETPRAMEVTGMEGEADDENGEDDIDGGDGGSHLLSMKVVLEMYTIAIEANMAM